MRAAILLLLGAFNALLAAMLASAIMPQPPTLDCRPFYTWDKKKCLAVASKCWKLYRIKLKWAGPGKDGGCQCWNYCGYKNWKTCKSDHSCYWDYKRQYCVQKFPGDRCQPYTKAPTKTPTKYPTVRRTSSPTSKAPSYSPSAAPTQNFPITKSPTTAAPTHSPTRSPTTSAPSHSPSTTPTTSAPTKSPSHAPVTSAPTYSPQTSKPTKAPSKKRCEDSAWVKIHKGAVCFYQKDPSIRSWGWTNPGYLDKEDLPKNISFAVITGKDCKRGTTVGYGQLQIDEYKKATFSYGPPVLPDYEYGPIKGYLGYDQFFKVWGRNVVAPPLLPISVTSNPYLITDPKEVPHRFWFYFHFTIYRPCKKDDWPHHGGGGDDDGNHGGGGDDGGDHGGDW